MSLGERSRARARRRAFPIHAYVGANGSGKSLAAVHDTLPSLDIGRRVLSTVPLLGADGGPHPLCEPLDDWRKLLDAEHCDVLLDEVTGVASSRETAGLPPQVANLLVQLRRRDLLLRWTAPSWLRADKIIRECSQAVTFCMGFAPATAREDEREWRENRLFLWRTYDARVFDEFTANKREKARPVARQLLWRPGSRAESAYDTLAQVLTLGVVNDAGLCLDCGGRRSAARCVCDGARSRTRKAAQLRSGGDENVEVITS